jgi:hypothetical protein
MNNKLEHFMNNKLEQCINRVQDEIKTIETSLADTSNHLTTAVEQKAESLEAGWKNALAKCDAKREEAGQAGQRLRQFLEEKKDELISKYENWKIDREIEKLEKHADKKEQQAVDAVVVAAFALLEAEVAIVEALKARKIAIEVAG